MKISAAKLLTIIAKQEENYDFNDFIKNYIDIDDLQDAIDNDSLQEYLEGLNDDYEITDIEEIYCHAAIEYIKENDPSMIQCFEIASEYGYDTKNLNSTILASLLKSRKNKDDYAEFIENVIEEFAK